MQKMYYTIQEQVHITNYFSLLHGSMINADDVLFHSLYSDSYIMMNWLCPYILQYLIFLWCGYLFTIHFHNFCYIDDMIGGPYGNDNIQFYLLVLLLLITYYLLLISNILTPDSTTYILTISPDLVSFMCHILYYIHNIYRKENDYRLIVQKIFCTCFYTASVST